LKVIGKGGFGKVFLVQKISSGKNKGNAYAMKSIRKDVILDYG
jgi:serine/threonine protein kinase